MKAAIIGLGIVMLLIVSGCASTMSQQKAQEQGNLEQEFAQGVQESEQMQQDLDTGEFDATEDEWEAYEEDLGEF